MVNVFSSRFMPLRATALLAIGAVVIIAARARHIQDQHPPVTVAPAPELSGDWLNTPAPITLKQRLGKVTMVEFWTFACSNCQANLAGYERIQHKFAGTGFTILSVHTPELPEEYKVENLKAFLHKKAIDYPVLMDNEYLNWNRWKQEYWPSVYLIDKKGNIREKWVGELSCLGANGEDQLDAWIAGLLKED
jgi:peroxiredoxin